MRYNNYHKHTHHSNLRTIDSVAKPIDYINRAVELGHTTYFTTEHGFQGNIYEAFTLCQENNLKCIYGVEAYYVNDIKEKDRSNFHLMLIAMTEKARREINKIMSVANKEGFYYKPRIDLKLLLSLNPNETVVTTACVAGPLFKYKEDSEYDWFNDFFIPVKDYFGKNFYLEVQDHLDEKQVEYNKKIMKLHKEYNIPIIHANDSHYIYPEDSKYRDLFLKAKGINYPEESGFCLDYPDSDEIYKRYQRQGVLTEEQVTEALNNTLIFDNAEGIFIDKEFKIPKVTNEDGNVVLKRLLNEGWKRERKKIPKEKWDVYKKQIRYEEKIVEDCGMADYFILDNMVVNRAVDKYGAILTRSGRGCFTEDALVHTENSIKSIKDVKVGDKVITSDGKFNKVLKTMCYDIDEELVQIKHLYGTDTHHPAICTLDHKILIKNKNGINWVEVSKVCKDDYVCVPKIKVENQMGEYIDLNDYNVFGFDFDDEFIYEKIEGTGRGYPYSPSDVAEKIGVSKSTIEKFANMNPNIFKRTPEKYKSMMEYIPFNSQIEYHEYIESIRTKKIKRFIKVDKIFNTFIGLMYGDGYVRNHEFISLAINTETEKNSFNRNIFNEIAKRINIKVFEKKSNKKNLTQLFIRSKILCEFCLRELFKSKLHQDKVFNSKWFYQCKENQLGIIDGFLHSDGSIDREGGRINFDNTSKSIINAYKLLCLMTNSGVNSISFRKGRIDERGFNCKDSYKLRINPNSNNSMKRSCRTLEDDNYYYLPVHEIKRLPKQKTKVYDIEVENNHSYLLNNMIVHNSSVSFYINKLLGLTEVDRISAPITLYPTRFMSAERILNSRSLPDIDLNFADVTPVIQASKDILGEDGIYYMIAYKPLQESSAFRLWCKAHDLNIKEYDEVAKNLENYENDPKWRDLIEGSKKFRGVIESVAPSPCFPAGTLVQTSTGYKEIQDIQKGDYVLTHKNEFKQVINTMSRHSDEAVELTFQGSVPFVSTPNHPFYIRHKEKTIRKKNKDGIFTSKRKFSDPEWIHAENIKKGDYVGIAINQNSIIPDINDIYELDIDKDIKDTDVRNPDFWRIVGQRFRSAGHGAKNKRLTNTIFDLPVNLLRNFLEGYFSADGHYIKDTKKEVYSTISKELAYGIEQCVYKVYHTPCAMRTKNGQKAQIEGRIVNTNTAYDVRFKFEPGRSDQGFYENGYMWLPFRSIKTIDYDGTVYNLSVQDDESYTVNNFIVHNCSFLLSNDKISEMVGLIKVGDEICCCLDGYNCDVYKFLKND